MQEKLKIHIKNRFPQLLNGKLLVAVSGGVDSMVLLHLMCQLQLDIAVAHCNFKLRAAESDADFSFVKLYCAQWNIPFYGQDFQTEAYAKEQKVSIQIGARSLRYSWFETLLERENCSALITAHHLDDAVETFLINLSRGTGIEGLLGIPEQNNRVFRPLLIFSREEILQYAADHHIQWREDRTNAETKYLRNKIRKQIVPIFKSVNPAFLDSFQNTVQYLKQAESMLRDAAAFRYEQVVEKRADLIYFCIAKLTAIENYPAYLHYWLRDYGFTAWEDINELVRAETGKKICSASHVLLKHRSHLILAPKALLETPTAVYLVHEHQNLNQPITIKIQNHEKPVLPATDLEIFVDKDSLKFPLTLRHWREGDYFYPLGMRGSKKLSKYFKDEKYSQIDKNAAWILCSQDQIVWIIGGRMDERFKVKDTTINILKIQVTK